MSSASELVWYSELTEADVTSLESEDLEMLIDALNDAVMVICTDFGLFQ